MFLSEDRFEVVRVDCGIASIPPFRIDVPSSSESIWFSAETTRAEPDNKIELGKVLVEVSPSNKPPEIRAREIKLPMQSERQEVKGSSGRHRGGGVSPTKGSHSEPMMDI